jgi:hypothetical protein
MSRYPGGRKTKKKESATYQGSDRALHSNFQLLGVSIFYSDDLESRMFQQLLIIARRMSKGCRQHCYKRDESS